MLELPEAETLRRDLEADLVGHKFASLSASGAATIAPPASLPAAKALVTGAKVTAVRRRGAVLLFVLDNEHTVVLEVGAGTVVLVPAASSRSRAAPVVPARPSAITFGLDDGRSLVFEPWGPTGSVQIHPSDQVPALAMFARVGFDPIDVPVSWTVLAQALVRRPGPIKALLADGSVMAGVGDVYSDEILFVAGIRHDRDAARLSPQEIRRLYRAVIEVLHEAIRKRGCALDFVDLAGQPGQYELAVYGRDGQMSPRGRAVVQKAKVNGRFTYFCPTQV